MTRERVAVVGERSGAGCSLGWVFKDNDPIFQELVGGAVIIINYAL